MACYASRETNEVLLTESILSDSAFCEGLHFQNERCPNSYNKSIFVDGFVRTFITLQWVGTALPHYLSIAR